MKINPGNKNPILKLHRFHSPIYPIREYYDIFRMMHKFSKSGKMVPEFPYYIQLQTQSYCNGRCIMCPYSNVHKKLKQGKMRWGLYKKIVDECATNNNLKQVCLMLQNEPFLDKRIFKFIDYFKNSGSKAITSIVTNGTLLYPRTVSKILKSDLDVLMISLNAHTEKTYKKLSPNFDFKKVMENLNNLVSQDLSHLYVIISYVITKYNKFEIKKSMKYWHSVGVETRSMDLLNRCGALKNFYELKTTPSLTKIFKKFIKKILDINCSLPFTDLSILFNGDIIVCCNDWNRNVILGNVKKNSIVDIFNSNQLNDIRRKTIDGEYHKIASCKLCSLSLGSAL